jgi:hypothetical protein
MGQTRTSSLAAAGPLPPRADIGPGGQSVGQAAQFCLGRRVASPVTATTDFLAPDILNKCGRAVPARAPARMTPKSTGGLNCGKSAFRLTRTCASNSGMPPFDPGCVETSHADERRERSFFERAISDQACNRCGSEVGLERSPFYRRHAALSFYTTKTHYGHVCLSGGTIGQQAGFHTWY